MDISRLSSKVSIKIWSGFIAVLLIMGAIVGYSYVQLNIIGNKIAELDERRVPNLLATEELVLEWTSQMSAVLGYLASGEEKFVKEMNDAIEQLEGNIDFLEDNAIDKDRLSIAKEAVASVRPLPPQVLNLYRTQGRERALEYLLMAVEPAKLRAFTILNDYKEYQEEAVHQDVQGIQDIGTSLIRLSIVLLIVALILGIVIAALISRIISRPLIKLKDAADKIAGGDLDVEIDVSSKDEIGALAQAFAKAANNTNEAMADINIASEQVALGAGQVSDSSMVLSQGAAEQASSIEELTASLEEVSTQTKLNAEHAKEANKLTELAMNNAKQGDEQMRDMLGAMENINASSSNISKIIKVIDEIAFQTNILALNAAIEAARAGQHGKGFAVVAEEVRNLAARSADAAKETTDMIEESIRRAEGGTKIAQDTAKALKEIVEDIAQAAKLVGDIAVASNEQASAIEQINQGVMQISQVVQNNSATAEESAAASEELSGQADLLREAVNKFKLKGHTHPPKGPTDLYREEKAGSKGKEKKRDKHATKKQRIAVGDEGESEGYKDRYEPGYAIDKGAEDNRKKGTAYDIEDEIEDDTESGMIYDTADEIEDERENGVTYYAEGVLKDDAENGLIYYAEDVAKDDTEYGAIYDIEDGAEDDAGDGIICDAEDVVKDDTEYETVYDVGDDSKGGIICDAEDVAKDDTEYETVYDVGDDSKGGIICDAEDVAKDDTEYETVYDVGDDSKGGIIYYAEDVAKDDTEHGAVCDAEDVAKDDTEYETIYDAGKNIVYDAEDERGNKDPGDAKPKSNSETATSNIEIQRKDKGNNNESDEH